MSVAGAWVDQAIEEVPQVYASVQIDDVWYLVAGKGASNFPTVIEVEADGSYTEWIAPGSYGFVFGCAVAVGDRIVISESNSGSTTAYVSIFDTAAKTWSRISTAGPFNTPQWSQGAVGPDGKAYFPPLESEGSHSGIQVLVYDPVGNSLSFTNFGGTLPANTSYAGAVMGGDGKMYFTPGYKVANGVSWDGTVVVVVDFGTMTCSTITPPAAASPGGGGAVHTHWALPAEDGIYVGIYWNRGIYHVTEAGGFDLLAVADPFGGSWTNGDELENQVDTHTALYGQDGKIYAIGSEFLVSSSYTPVVTVLDPVDDRVTFHRFPTMTGYPFLPPVSWWFGDDKIRSLPVYISSGETFPKVFENGLETPNVAYAAGAESAILALGSEFVEIRIG